ncbi:hypothetical protein [Natrinema salifodinae]|uniref:Uncharacterized protein n=1 Tax=Natrinema salifodinae TaxID=1202768 RepID=A0A1I0NER6_9EURY|nr:hypothetical protein [Natrinema salifodinae]SEV99724.1 hypothetical protein SAMN05216285_1643 [Natrinema salifodinae]
MPDDSMRHGSEWYRRGVMKAAGGATVLGLQTGVAGAQESETESSQEAPDATDRISGAERLSVRDFHEENYEITHIHRRKEAVETLLKDPEANSVAREWIANFVGYEPLSNHLDAISIQGPTDYTVEGGLDQGGWEITARNRQTIFGLVDRQHNELVALHISDPIDVSWQEEYSQEELQRVRVMREHPDVQDFAQDRDTWAVFKVAEEIFAWKDRPHGEVSSLIFYGVGDDEVSVAVGYLDVTDSENPELVDLHFVEDFVRYPVQKMARQISPADQTVLGEVPAVPLEQRPLKTAEDGFHRFDLLPEESFEQDNWQIEWEPPETMGVTFYGDYNGTPVFRTMNAMATPTGYNLPPREGRNTVDWFFPDHEPVFNGHHLYWDIHSIPFGGPGQLGKIDYPERRGHPSGFQFRTHYHTGAQGRGSIDFHSGAQFGPYNYNISYEFFSDGRIVPIWRRHGPGHEVESLRNYGATENWDGEDNVTMQYLHYTALEVTPGTTEGVETHVFDGDQWITPDEEFYLEGEPGQKVRFSNPDGSEQIDIPMDRSLELVVVPVNSDEIGPADSQKTRVEDLETELEFYHPAQYVDGDSIQNQRVITWLIMEGTVAEVPHPAAVSGYVAQSELQINGYDD